MVDVAWVEANLSYGVSLNGGYLTLRSREPVFYGKNGCGVIKGATGELVYGKNEGRFIYLAPDMCALWRLTCALFLTRCLSTSAPW